MMGWHRSDGRKGIRNTILVAYTVECAHHVCTQISQHTHTQRPGPYMG